MDAPIFEPAQRIDNIDVSETLVIGKKAMQMRAEGADVILLNTGEPDFDTPGHIKAAAIEAIQSGDTKYTALDGTVALKTAVQAKFKRENNIDYALDEICVSTGAKQVLFNAFMATLNEGDEVIIPTPYWTSYSDIVSICGGIPILVECGMDAGFLLTAPELEKNISAKTKWVLLNSPSNPTGAIYTKKDYEALLQVLERYTGIWLMVDDMYEHLLFDQGVFATPAEVRPDLKGRILTINGVSKAYAMTGWRIGYGGGPKNLIKSMAVVQSQSTSCASSISQAAATEALNGPQEMIKAQCDMFEARRNIVVTALNKMEGIRCPLPKGAFYTFATCEDLIGSKTADGQLIENDADFCRYILEDAHVAIVPGRAFGLSPYFRISFATSTDLLEKALKRMSVSIQKLQKR